MKLPQSSCVFAIASVVLATVLSPGRSFAISISATSRGSLMLTTDGFPKTVTNGDFLISGRENTRVGDGKDERTDWTFDFTGDPNLSALSTTELLSSAKLTLTLTTCCKIETDKVTIRSLPSIETNLIMGLPRNTTQTVELELLDFYSSSDILGVLNKGTGGTLPMAYFDDAIVSFAQLELSDTSTQSVPEPSAMLGLLTLGTIEFVRQRVKKHQTCTGGLE